MDNAGASSESYRRRHRQVVFCPLYTVLLAMDHARDSADPRTDLRKIEPLGKRLQDPGNNPADDNASGKFVGCVTHPFS